MTATTRKRKRLEADSRPATKPAAIEPAQSSFEAVPEPIVSIIFSHLHPLDLCRAQQVCRLWRALARDEHLWLAGFLSRWGEVVTVRAQSCSPHELWRLRYRQWHTTDLCWRHGRFDSRKTKLLRNNVITFVQTFANDSYAVSDLSGSIRIHVGDSLRPTVEMLCHAPAILLHIDDCSRCLVSAHFSTGLVRVWDLANGTILKEFDLGEEVWFVDSRDVMSDGFLASTITGVLYSCPSPLVDRPPARGPCVHDPVIYVDSSILVTKSPDQTKLTVVNRATLQVRYEFHHPRKRRGRSVLPSNPNSNIATAWADGEKIASGGGDGTWKLFSAYTGKLLLERSHPRASHISCIQFDQTKLVTSQLHNIYVWDVVTGALQCTIRATGLQVAQFHLTDSFLAVCGEGDTGNGELDVDSELTMFRFHMNGTRLARRSSSPLKLLTAAAS